MGLYHKHRPTELRQVLGQNAVINQLNTMLQEQRVPHAILLTGPSGTGKTTLARILAKSLGISEILEKNCALDNGIDMVRDIESKVHLKSLFGNGRMYIIDECHGMSSSAQKALLKLLEDTPQHVYFVLCTTDPQKVERAVQTRCTTLKLQDIPAITLAGLVKAVADLEGYTKIPSPMEIAQAASGSARKALVLLEQCASSGEKEDWKQILDTLGGEDDDIFPVVRAIYSGRKLSKSDWEKLKALPEGDIERVRALIMSYGSSVLCGGNMDAIPVMDMFKDPFFYSKKPGFLLAVAKATTRV